MVVVLYWLLDCVGEISRLCKEKDTDLDKYDHSREELQKRLAQLERDMQMALTQEKQAHEEDVDRLSREKVATAA